MNELFGEQADVGAERFEKIEIWNALYDFQKDSVVFVICKLNTYGGCIITDSEGLGKTFEELAIIKYFEIGMNRVLVLTFAKLYDMSSFSMEKESQSLLTIKVEITNIDVY